MEVDKAEIGKAKVDKAEVNKKRIIEAALFMSSNPVPLERLGRLIGVAAAGYTKSVIGELNKEYTEKGNVFEILEESGGYMMTLRAEYSPFVKEFAKEAEVSPHSLKTLAYISKKDGILKSSLARHLGSQVYKDVHELTAKGFLVQKKKGRTSELKTSDKFKAYFGANTL